MKRIGDLYTIKGSWDPDGGYHRIQLFDGRFDTGFRVVKFEHALTNPINSAEYKVVLGTLDSITSTFNWGNNAEIAWGYGGNNASAVAIQGFANFSFVDPDNMIIEDLFIVGDNTSADEINYMITLEKYDLSEWRGALAMTRNKSQG
jgi:hypothetical protein